MIAAPILEDYQEDGVAWLSRRKLALVIAPAGSGKTIIAAAALARVISLKIRKRQVRVGWMCNTIEQAEQARAALSMFEVIKISADCQVECAAAGTDWTEKDVLIVDEAHHITSESWSEQVDTALGAIWAFTATPNTGDPDRDVKFQAMFPDQFVVDRKKVSAARLVEARVILLNASDDVGDEIDLAVKQYMRKFQNGWRRGEVAALRRILGSDASESAKSKANAELSAIMGQLKAMAYWNGVTQVGIASNKARNQAGVEAALKHVLDGDKILILVNHTGHGEEITQMICERGAVGKMAHSKMGAKKRRAVLEEFRNGKIDCLVATSLADEGLDLPMVNVLVLISGGKSRGKAEQRTGRALRAFAGKSHATIYDFADTCHWLMEKHSQARQKLYRDLGYKIEGDLKL